MTLTLYTFGPGMGLPDPSPFVMKADLLLKMSGLPYVTDTTGFRKAPKGKLPYLRDGDALIADSTLIRWHLEKRHGIDFDPGYSPAEIAVGWAVEKMLDEHVYWGMVDARWLDDANFDRGPRHFFGFAPAPLRPLICAMARRSVRGRLKAQGFGLHAKAEREALVIRSIDALSAILGDRPYLLGETVSGSDATVFAFVAGLLCPYCETPLREAVSGHANLVAYAQRMGARYYPDHVWPAAA
ncbi:glutathione S-transferase family protein [Methylobacterium sp. sgz302541]|uniref:glutathione S-transferase family protein n=1 Tax=unclassified Methylobacterium TaxID=2615210 RepID=UPI003D346591